MKTPTVISWAVRATLIPLLFALGCGGTSKPTPIVPLQAKIAFSSSRALDGSDAVNTNQTGNIWVTNADGSGATPLTKLTADNASSQRAAWSPDGKSIAYDSGRALDGSDAGKANGTRNIWVMNADGSGATPLTKLTAPGAYSESAAWSPDGTKIAFHSQRTLDGSDAVNTNWTTNIWVANADGSAATPLTRLTALNAGSFWPVWSPDRTKIAFHSQRALDGSDALNTNNSSNIWVMNADGTGPTPLTRLTAFNANSSFPVWSPDGKKIAFLSQRALDGSDAANTNSTLNLWSMNADGSDATPLTRLTALNARSFSTVWSPDGTKIAFHSQRALDGSDAANTNSTLNLWSMNADGSGATPLTKLTAPGAYSESAAWSPDGKSIAYDSGRALDGSDAVNTNQTGNIWVMNADGTGSMPLTRLTASGAYNGNPEWRP